MGTFGIIVLKIPFESLVKGIALAHWVQIYIFLFDRPPKPLDKGIVSGPSPPVHADLNPMPFQTIYPFLRGVLACLLYTSDAADE